MYQKTNGQYKSDFRLLGSRYQHTWDTTVEAEALEMEEDLKAKIKLAKKTVGDISNVSLDWLLGFSTEAIFAKEQAMKLSELKDYMYEKVWRTFADSKNPLSRMDKMIRYFGDVDIRTLNTKAIEKFKAHLVKEGRAEKTINHYLSTLNTSLDKVSKTGRVILEHKPDISDLRMEKSGVKRDIVYSHADEKHILKLLKDEYLLTGLDTDFIYYHFIRIEFKLGLRPSEFTALTIGDVDFNNKTVTISKGSNRGKTKNGVVRTLPIEGTTIDSLRELARLTILSRFPNADLEGTPKVVKELMKEPLKEIVTSELPIILRKLPISGLSKYQCESRWQKLKLKMGWYGAEEYKDYVQYCVRHTVATRLASELSFGAHQLMKFMGHRSIATSLQYVHLNVDDLRGATKIGEKRLEVL